MRRANCILRYSSIHSGDDSPPDSAAKYLLWDTSHATNKPYPISFVPVPHGGSAGGWFSGHAAFCSRVQSDGVP